ncbi:sugar nucleotide-binding protein [Rubinisphaera sp.]|uniref:sugar nucleotide-binding protein n=1 Tax=Rubinisphaera sp. TaxID=2024857 RepID=UPI0025FD85BD|nr:sugar nucleotide-binding protein [Rubinisphaera sp.]
MNTLIIFGVDTVAGSNLAQSFSSSHQVIGICERNAPEISNCEILSGGAVTKQIGKLLDDLKPERFIDASSAGDSAWNPQATIGSEEQCQTSAELANACAERKIPFTLISSDAVLTGPWMFHEETSEEHSTSIIGQRLLKLEQLVQSVSSESLIVRTHLFGWNHSSESMGWIEEMLEGMLRGKVNAQWSQPGYATPIIVSEFATILSRAFEENLTGLYHIAGAERVNRIQFARRLAQQFEISWYGSGANTTHYTEAERLSFGCGESSLQTLAIRRELCVAMPTLAESTLALCKQSQAVLFPVSQEQPISRAA